jgi:hypothetical protein
MRGALQSAFDCIASHGFGSKTTAIRLRANARKVKTRLPGHSPERLSGTLRPTRKEKNR